MEVVDRRRAENRLTEQDRGELSSVVVRLRDEESMSWADIAEQIGCASPSTARKLYEETGRDHHGLLPGKGGRNVEWAQGEWCDARCLGAHPNSKCECKCLANNHSKGVDHASEILDNMGTPEEKKREVLEYVAGIVANNIGEQ